MKNFIAGLAMLLLLSIFILQPTLELVNEQRLTRFDELVNNSINTAITDGYFTTANITALRSNLKLNFNDLSDSDIYISVTTTPKYRLNYFDEREAIYYDIRIPVRKLFVAPALIGMTDDENQYISQKKGYVLSEVLAP